MARNNQYKRCSKDQRRAADRFLKDQQWARTNERLLRRCYVTKCCYLCLECIVRAQHVNVHFPACAFDPYNNRCKPLIDSIDKQKCVRSHSVAGNQLARKVLRPPQRSERHSKKPKGELQEQRGAELYSRFRHEVELRHRVSTRRMWTYHGSMAHTLACRSNFKTMSAQEGFQKDFRKEWQTKLF